MESLPGLAMVLVKVFSSSILMVPAALGFVQGGRRQKRSSPGVGVTPRVETTGETMAVYRGVPRSPLISPDCLSGHDSGVIILQLNQVRAKISPQILVETVRTNSGLKAGSWISGSTSPTDVKSIDPSHFRSRRSNSRTTTPLPHQILLNTAPYPAP
jgi:hypothetical protein